MFLNGEEYKFRGENQLLNLIAQNYHTIKKLITWENFKAKLPEAPEWYYIENQIESGNSSTSLIPEELQKLKVVEKDGTLVYFNKGVDSTGQLYSIAYDTANSKLVLDFNSNVEETFDPVLQDYKDLKKKLDKYLKQLDKEA